MKSTIPQIRIITFIVFIIFILLTISAFSIMKTAPTKISSTQDLKKDERISLQNAFAKKLISAKLRGMGAAFGDAITVEINNKTKFPLKIKIIPGTKLISKRIFQNKIWL